MRKILVTGGNGQLGSRLAEWKGEGCSIIAMDRADWDITNPEATDRVLDEHLPDVVINAAAYTAVDRAESDQGQAFRVNADGPKFLASACAKRGIDFIHISTDYVFDGRAERPYQSGDSTDPKGVYARSKREGEQAVESAFAEFHEGNWWIIRVAWLYDDRGQNFLQTMLRLGQSGKALRVVNDQWGAPTAAGPLANALVELALNPQRVPAGIWHYGTLGPVTWYEFARAIFEESGLKVDVSPCTTAEYPTPAPRPTYSYLDGGPFAKALNWQQVDWRSELKTVLKKID